MPYGLPDAVDSIEYKEEHRTEQAKIFIVTRCREREYKNEANVTGQHLIRFL